MYRPAESVPSDLQITEPAHVYVVFGMPDLDPTASGGLDHLSRESTLLWDRQGWLSRTRDHLRVAQLPPAHKVYVANEDEACGDFNARTLEELVPSMPPQNFQSAVIKRGSEGCVVIEGPTEQKSVSSVAGFPIETNDTIGSGDAFAGGLAAGIAAGALVREAAHFANAAASTFLKLGGDPLIPEFEESVRALAARMGDS